MKTTVVVIRTVLLHGIEYCHPPTNRLHESTAAKPKIARESDKCDPAQDISTGGTHITFEKNVEKLPQVEGTEAIKSTIASIVKAWPRCRNTRLNNLFYLRGGENVYVHF